MIDYNLSWTCVYNIVKDVVESRVMDDKYELNKPLWKDNHSSFNMRGYNINTLPVIRRGGKVYNLFEIIDVLNGEVIEDDK